MQELYEKLGLFYIGHDVDKESQSPTDELTLLKNKNFTTHAAIIGMTGSGKTGLGIGLIEEAAIDNIPSIVIDPKGDMGNLLLTDPAFESTSFEPWVRDEARSKNKQTPAYAKKISAMWKESIEGHHQDSARVEKFTNVEKTIYTPGSSAGISVNVLSSLEAPPANILEDSDAFTSYLSTTVSSLLSLIGIEADPVESVEYLLLAQLISTAWMEGDNLSLEDLIGRIISPPFKKIGVLPLESFYPQGERFKFATKFNSVLASPTFKTWMEGDTLDIQRMLYDEEGKAKIAIFSISHLSDDERMFFVTLLLNKYIAWMRRQSGASSLKTILYMDEIFGFFPPTSNPPSKEPMLLLLKQARAFGVGVVLSTQNPVDLDYKGLSNIGTWFIGRLQTTQDINRVIEGLGGKTGSSYDKKEIRKLLANLSKRTFFLKSAHLDDIRLFSTRWVMSYLKGPLKRDEISALMEERKSQTPATTPESAATGKKITRKSGYESYISIDKSIPQCFRPGFGGENHYSASLMATLNLHFFNQTRGIDFNESYCLELPINKGSVDLDWESASNEAESRQCFKKLPKTAPSEISYAPLPDFISSDRKLSAASRALKEWIYHSRKLELFRTRSPQMESQPGETSGDFRVRVSDALNDKKEIEIDKLKERYEKKEKTLVDRLQRAMAKLEKEKGDTTNSYIRAGARILGALLGRSPSTIATAGTSVLKERGDVGRAEERVKKYQADIEELGYELEEKLDEVAEEYDPDNIEIEEFAIKLRKTDIVVDGIALVWSAEQ
ncbi:hypothetical protein BOW39_10970 [Solemya velum gill symbiont]|uniref:helicase HerA domain-containing protein n=2 Tax=Solemya velum gill symbiont TaxID=2340 RepID=UPI0009965E5A|nr:DUF87 domain-containing protein [Solemya velum gill symbiont]OOZ48354.1 hypothetical protein BOW39_10970 [Solemya velum gill symbiont]OOZ71599.1 hypothetical protein BOW49_12410 [Solemya velum gill symbiont]